MSIKVDGIVDSNTVLWVYWKRCLMNTAIRSFHPCDSFEDGVAWLKETGRIKPDPLEEAIEAADKLSLCMQSPKHFVNVCNILRKLASDLTS